MDDKSLTDKIYDELADGLKTGLDWTHFIAKHGSSKGPLYSAVSRFFRDMEPKLRELSQVQAKLDEAGLALDSLDQKIKEAKDSLAELEERKGTVSEEIKVLEAKLTERSNLLEHAAELGKLSFDIERLRQLRAALTEIGAKSGLTGKEAVGKFFDDLKDYGVVLEAKALLEGLQTQIETKKVEAENWQAKHEALRRKHDDAKEAIGAVYALRAKGVKASQIPVWQRILGRFETIEQFDQYLSQHAEVTELLNTRKEDAEAYELRLTNAKSQLETMEEERAKIEAGIDALRVGGLKELEAVTEATKKQLKTVAASQIKETQAIGQEVRKEFAGLFAQVDQLVEKVFQLGQQFEGLRQELQKYDRVKEVLVSHATAAETGK